MSRAIHSDGRNRISRRAKNEGFVGARRLLHLHVSTMALSHHGASAATGANMSHHQRLAGIGQAPSGRILYSHFDVKALKPDQRLLAWRDRLGQIIDVVLPTRSQLVLPFRAAINRYDVGEFTFCDAYTDRITQDRTISRISKDNARGIVFHVFIEGDPGSVVARSRSREGLRCEVGILAVDLDQPLHIVRHGCRHVTLFVPPERLQDVFRDPGALHGRVLSPDQPSVQMVLRRVMALCEDIQDMTVDDAYRRILAIVHLIAAAFAEQAGLIGGKRAIARTAMFDEVRGFVRANLGDASLSPESVLESLGLPRPTVYRLFQHEGGLGTYIRDLRLRAAATNLVRFPGMAVIDVANTLGFKSASDFTRAFRRAYDIAPHEVRLNERGAVDQDAGTPPADLGEA
jgi:AraC-like DNA-binding protein